MKSRSLAEKNIIKQDEHCGLFCKIANVLEDDPSNGIECLRNWQKFFFSRWQGAFKKRNLRQN